MPRPQNIRKDLSAGWNRLHKLWKNPLHTKVTHSLNVLRKALSQHSHPVVCWSGGKDSTIALHLVLSISPSIPVIFIKSGFEFPETTPYIERIANDWNLNLTVQSSEFSFWDIGNEYGWPIFGKSIAANVERAKRTGNIRKQLSAFERLLIEENFHISTRCSAMLQEKPSKQVEKSLNCNLKILGIRAEESRARVRLWVDHGEMYYVKRYYKRGDGIWKMSPVSVWLDKDIYEYKQKHKIPFCDLYKLGYPRNGCWPCAMAIRNGQLSRLKRHHPHLFNYLIYDTNMGKELLKAKKLFSCGSAPIGHRKTILF